MWQRAFPHEQILIVKDFFDNPQEALQRIAAFLGIAPFATDTVIPWSNKGRTLVDRLDRFDWISEGRTKLEVPAFHVPPISEDDLKVVDELRQYYGDLK